MITAPRHRAGLAVLAAGLLLFAARPWLDGEPAKYVHVRWAPDTDEATIRDLEWRFGLREQQHEGQSYGYDLLDPSPSNIRALLDHPAVDDTHDLDRTRLTPAETALTGDSRTGLAWRWRLEAVVPVVAALAPVLLVAGGLILTLSRRRLDMLAASTGAAVRRFSWPGVAAWISRRLPVLGPLGFGVFRVALAVMLAVLLLHNGINDSFLPLEQQRNLPLPLTGWIHDLAATPGAAGILQRALVVALALFAAGILAAPVFVVIALGFNVWFCMWALSAGTHPLGTLPLALIALVIAPWGEGIGFDRWRAQRRPASRVPYGYAPWILALALGIGFAAAAFAKMRGGVAWVANGTVRYHFMAEAEVALVDWGLWIAAHPAAAVLASLGAVVGETVVIAGAFAGPAVRLLAGAMAASLFAGFILFHGAAWPAWWVLLLGFLPWEWIDRARAPEPVATARPLPRVAMMAAFLLVLQQIPISWFNREIPPYFSAYDMYSATFSSPEQFERANGGPRFQVLVRTPERDVDVGDCVRADTVAIEEMTAALRGDEAVPAALPRAEAAVTRCAAAIPEGSIVRVVADQREFDWTRGRTGYRYRDRLVAEWPVNR